MGTHHSLTTIENIRLLYLMEKHLVDLMKASDYGIIFTSVTCPLSAQIHKSILNYKTIKEFPANRFADKFGNCPFGNAHDSIKTFVQIYQNFDK